jgi:hypothetical protein
MTDCAADLTAYDPAVPVSAIVVNWNGREHLDTCLGSLLQQTLRGVEVVLVDNASSDGSVACASSSRSTTSATPAGSTPESAPRAGATCWR